MPESHSQRVLLRGDAGLGTRMHSAPRPQPCPLSQLGCSALRPLSTNGPKQAAWSCIQQGETPLREQSTATMCLLSGNQASSFLTQHSALQGQRGAGLLWAPWAVLLCWGSPAPETHSQSVLLRAEAGLGAPLPSAPRPLPYPLSQLGRSAPRPRRTDGPKRASGSCIQQGATLLR